MKQNPEPTSPLLSAEALACAAPLNARSRWLCCFASCSKVSSSLTRCSRSAWRAFCHRLLCVWASAKKSRQAWHDRNRSNYSHAPRKVLSQARATPDTLVHSVRLNTISKCSWIPKLFSFSFKGNFEQLTLIMALEVIRNRVALSVTWRIFSPASPVRRKLSSSDKDLWQVFKAKGT